MPRYARPILIALLLTPVAFEGAAVAQDATAPPAKPKYEKYGSPLNTLMTTHLWTDVPPAQNFVKETRPDIKSLNYTPLTGVDPDRPKPRDTANISALQAELESDAAKNEKKARVLRPAVKRKASAARP